MALDESMSSSKHEMTPMKLKADFRENYAAAEGGGGGGGRCSVEIGQENLIALLLKQQEDMLRELKKQKKGLQLLEAHKDEISNLVISSIKKHLQTDQGYPQVEKNSGTSRVKRVSRHIRRRRKLGRSVDKSRHQTAAHNVVELFDLPVSRFSNQISQQNSTLTPGDTCCHSDTTVIRQRVEQQAPQIEVSLDGLWLPTLSSFSPHDAGGAEKRCQPKDLRWAEKSSGSAMVKSSEANTAPGIDEVRPRPTTVASQALSRSKPNKSVPKVGEISRSATASGPRAKAEVKVDGPIEASSSHERRRLDEAEVRGRRGYKRSLGEPPMLCWDRDEDGNKREEAAAMIHSTTTMLERSRALVAKAKAEVAASVIALASETPVGQRSGVPIPPFRVRTVDDRSIWQACCGHVSRVNPPNDSKDDGEQGRTELGTRGETCKEKENDAELGPARSILFPCLSPGPLGDDCVQRQRESPTDCSKRDSFELAKEKATHPLDHQQDDSAVHTVPKLKGDVGSRTAGPSMISGRPVQSRGCSNLTSVLESGVTADIKHAASLITESSVSRPTPASLATTKAVSKLHMRKRPTTAVEELGGSSSLRNVAATGIRPDTVASFPESDSNHRRCSGRSARGKRGGIEEGCGGASSPAKVDSEWENEIARNILSLYQTKLKVELIKKRGTREEELERTRRGYQTIEEEEKKALRERNIHHRKRSDLRISRQHTRSQARRTPPKHSPSRNTSNGDTLAASSPSFPSPHSKEHLATSAVRLRGGSIEHRTKSPASARGHHHRAANGGSRCNSSCNDHSAHRLHCSSATMGVTLDTTPLKTQMQEGFIDVATKKSGALTPVKENRPAVSSCAAGNSAADSHRRKPSTTTAGVNSTCASGVTAIGTIPATARAGATGRGGFRGSKTIAVPTRGGGDAVVIVPKRPSPIWFAGSGAVQAEWSALQGGARVVRDLETLEEQGRYSKYVAVVEGLLVAHLRADDHHGSPELVKTLWRQLVVTCTAFGVRSTENRRFERALELLNRAGTLLSRQVLDKQANSELRAFVFDAYGFYYLRRGKASAALDYVQKAMRAHAHMQDWGHVTKCHLHSAVVLSRLNRHDEALRCLGQVLVIVQEGKLDIGGNSPQKLCLVAICYHNIAVEQLILRHVGEACMSSQNARRLARLCLSYSNRWLRSFEGTHKLALAELARALPSTAGVGATGAGRGSGEAIGRSGDGEGNEQRELLKRLTEELFS